MRCECSNTIDPERDGENATQCVYCQYVPEFPHEWTLGGRGKCRNCDQLSCGDPMGDGDCAGHPDHPVKAIVEEISERSAYALASDADCASPDNSESPGALFLVRVRDSVLEHVEAIRDKRDDFGSEFEYVGMDAEIADSSVPIYTHDLMLTYVDLAAYNEDVSDFGAPTDGIQHAQFALYTVARNLVSTLAEEIRTAGDDE